MPLWRMDKQREGVVGAIKVKGILGLPNTLET
ncbi:hypothetical protein Gbro_0336 [Gordonia bronchialis DSM 43247]|uniref:Uncharacterized protein n=1 Tax=Gordonia bronchialis (strain ATCC 25592 / DSM 43247 / BCRC 13721 / JCM 3198 / KCTC 3076 / NBRC 16047 / NCTC 10667) TaxID=526226 RepID=D0LCE9_GORB4|nr:hypothetical protein Gbro_0336 [Gordonia bronchialis DSM 43247]